MSAPLIVIKVSVVHFEEDSICTFGSHCFVRQPSSSVTRLENNLSRSASSFSNVFSCPLVFQSAVFHCLLGFLLAILEILIWSTKLNRRFVADRVVVDVRVGGPNVSAAQESQRNRYITAWFSSFTPAWFFTGFN